MRDAPTATVHRTAKELNNYSSFTAIATPEPRIDNWNMLVGWLLHVPETWR